MEFLNKSINYPHEIYIKVLIAGKSKIGKSLFCLRMDTNSYLEFKKLNLLYKPTVGFEYYQLTIKINDKILSLKFFDYCG